MNDYDIIIIGAGVIGCTIARSLSRYDLNILLIEKSSDVGMGSSSANSAIIHSGHDPIPGTLKAITNVQANPKWDQFSNELNIPFERRGCFIVALTDEELTTLNILLERGCHNGVTGLNIISGDEMRKREPKINPDVKGALFTPSGGIVDVFAVTIAAAENAIQNGVKLLLNTQFEDFIFDNQRISGIKSDCGNFYSRWVINAAGLYSDDVMHKAGVRPEFFITPRRGEYFILDNDSIQIKNVLFPVPSASSKGILVLGSTHGNTIIGPNSSCVLDKEDRSVTNEGMEEIWLGAKKIIPSLQTNQIIASFTGLRSTGNAKCYMADIDYDHDFIIEIPDQVNGFVNIGGIESPGLSAAPAIAEKVIVLLENSGEILHYKEIWNPIRPARPRFKNLDKNAQIELIHKDSRYGRIVCRCEMVTEGEIIAEIHAPIPALSYDALKRRTWLGTGRCQGAFDIPKVVNILAKELDISPLEITKKGVGSPFLFRTTKSLEARHDD